MALALLGGTAMATDFRAPLPGGPLRYDFEKVQKNKSTFNFWSTGYMREADKAFMKHGFNTSPLTTLIFGKSEFVIADAFAGGKLADQGLTEYSNPRFFTTAFAPRISYSERGMMLGASWAYPVWANKGRVGIRGSVPLRAIKVEKDDEMEHAVTGMQSDVVKSGTRKTTIGAGGVGTVVRDVTSYKVDLLKNIKKLDAAGNVTGLISTDGTGKVDVNGFIYSAAIAAVGNNPANTPFVFVKANPGKTPLGGAVIATTAADNQAAAASFGANTAIKYDDNAAAITGLAGGFTGAVETGFSPVTAVDYAAGLAGDTSDWWITTVHVANGSTISDDRVKAIDALIDGNTQEVGQSLAERGYAFQTYQLTGLGDTDLDLFYSHNFSDRWMGEVYGGLVIPTGAGDKYYGNPYRMNLGNGDHFELKLGGKLAWATCKWMDLKADAHYNFALEATEHRMAAFTGATVKNFGPKADADVSWGRFVGSIDATLYHPKTKDIATTFGYEINYKTEDDITFKQKTMQNDLLGKKTVGGVLTANPVALSDKVARMNTEQIIHRAYVEGSYVFSKYLSMRVGGKYTFAGQNAPCESEAYTGFNVKF